MKKEVDEIENKRIVVSVYRSLRDSSLNKQPVSRCFIIKFLCFGHTDLHDEDVSAQQPSEENSEARRENVNSYACERRNEHANTLFKRPRGLVIR